MTAYRTYLPTAEAAAAQGLKAFENLEGPKLPEADLAAMTDYGFVACVKTAQTS